MIRLIPENKENIQIFNDKLKKYFLECDIKKINYLIVDTNENKIILAKKIYELKEEYSEEKVLELITKIISLDEISSDF